MMGIRLSNGDEPDHFDAVTHIAEMSATPAGHKGTVLLIVLLALTGTACIFVGLGEYLATNVAMSELDSAGPGVSKMISRQALSAMVLRVALGVLLFAAAACVWMVRETTLNTRVTAILLAEMVHQKKDE